MGEVIALAALDAGRTAAPPQLGAGGSQQQVMQAGQSLLPLGGAASVAAGAGKAPEPLARLLIQRTAAGDLPGGRALSQRHAQTLQGSRNAPREVRPRRSPTPSQYDQSGDRRTVLPGKEPEALRDSHYPGSRENASPGLSRVIAISKHRMWC